MSNFIYQPNGVDFEFNSTSYVYNGHGVPYNNNSTTFTGLNNGYIDFSYYPNPTNGKVAITSKTLMGEVMVYNVTGQLLYENKINALNTNVDLSSFATGTYFFKLKFDGDKEVNFKVIRN